MTEEEERQVLLDILDKGKKDYQEGHVTYCDSVYDRVDKTLISTVKTGHHHSKGKHKLSYERGKKMQTREFLGFDNTFVDPTLYRKFIITHIGVIREWACQTIIEGDTDWSTIIMKYVSDPTVSDADFYEITGNLALEIGTWCRSYVIAYVMCEENPDIDFVYAPPDDTGKEGVGYRYKAPWEYSDTEKALTWEKLVEILASYAFELGIYSIDRLTFTYAKL